MFVITDINNHHVTMTGKIAFTKVIITLATQINILPPSFLISRDNTKGILMSVYFDDKTVSRSLITQSEMSQ